MIVLCNRQLSTKILAKTEKSLFALLTLRWISSKEQKRKYERLWQCVVPGKEKSDKSWGSQGLILNLNSFSASVTVSD